MTNPALLFLGPAIGYVVVGVVCTVRRLQRPQPPALWLMGLVWLSLLSHLALIVWRDHATPEAPFVSAREATLVLSWLLVVAYLMTARWLRGIGVSGLVLGVAGLALIISGLTLPAQPEAVPTLLMSPWLLLHVPLVLLAYLTYTMAGVGAVMYLVVSSLLKSRRAIALSVSLPTLDSLERFSYRMAGLGFPVLTAGLMAGMVWSVQVWHQLIPDTPKQAVALFTWIVYAGYFHARLARGYRGRFCAWLLVAGLALIIVGLVIPIIFGGPHKFM
ncbi:MAG: cytochrome c biogenesis protein [Armatimonadetes bacterium]|nr:cytochrome c biogenesis protein [Armatimonadota bacterium]